MPVSNNFIHTKNGQFYDGHRHHKGGCINIGRCDKDDDNKTTPVPPMSGLGTSQTYMPQVRPPPMLHNNFGGLIAGKGIDKINFNHKKKSKNIKLTL